MQQSLPPHPPFVLRARVLTPLDSGGTCYEPDGVVEVNDQGHIAHVGDWPGWSKAREPSAPPPLPTFDLRPWVLLPGLVDLHAHLPQIPNAGLGAGMDLLTWLDRYIFPLEREFDAQAAERLAPAAYRALAAAGTTTAVLYGAVFEPSLEVAFRAAEAHGLRVVLGKVMMDRVTYGTLPPDRVLEVSLRQSADLCSRWHLRDGGRLRYAFTPRFAVSCSSEMLRESAALARQTGAYWQTHLSEDASEVQEVARLFPDARDYLDVYDRAGALDARTILAHACHLSDREVARLAESGARVAHCPSSNLFLRSGVMRLAHYLQSDISVGLGSDVAAGPELSLFAVMKAGAYSQSMLGAAGSTSPSLGPLDWLRLGTLAGARVLGLEASIGSLEPGKEADLIAVDPALTDPLRAPTPEPHSDPEDLIGRLIFRCHPDMVRAAWVRGKLLDAS